MKNLAVISISRNTGIACTNQLRHLLGNCVNIAYYCLAETPPSDLSSDLVVFTSPEAASEIAIRSQIPQLVARRSINYHYVDKLFAIPSGSDVMLVNDLPSSANETIALLQTLGITHINYHPYAPQMNYVPPCKIAVTPGESQFVPKSVTTVIDIQTRLIDITTIVEILLKLNLLKLYADFLSANYVQEIIRLIKNKSDDFMQIQRLEKLVQQKRLQDRKIAKYQLSDIIGQSPAILHTLELARKMAASESSILILGESGTGKELIAQSIHNLSERRNGPFVAINFAAMTETLLESELFGYLPGSFTGAGRQGAAGLFEEAHNGTIFLDEIGDAPPAFQVKLLRVLQEQSIRRIGSSYEIPINVRVIAATNCDLKQLIAAGKFRRDLYYRLNILPINLPPLRERGNDILLLAKAFYEKQRRSTLSADEYFSHIETALRSYNWPGNIRELQNTVEYLLTLSPAKIPTAADLPPELTAASPRSLPELEELALDAIEKLTAQNKPAGRRTLMTLLGLSETHIRKILANLADKKKITIHRGRNAIRINK